MNKELLLLQKMVDLNEVQEILERSETDFINYVEDVVNKDGIFLEYLIKLYDNLNYDVESPFIKKVLKILFAYDLLDENEVFFCVKNKYYDLLYCILFYFIDHERNQEIINQVLHFLKQNQELD